MMLQSLSDLYCIKYYTIIINIHIVELCDTLISVLN